MATFDNIIINTDERAISSDINSLQSLVSRVVADVLGLSTQNRAYSLGAIPTPSAPSSNGSYVLGGLGYSGIGGSLTISAGAIMHTSATVPAAPGAFDSSVRVGMLRSPVVLTAPNPGAPTWYWLRAQASAVVTNELRDVFDGSAFAPTNVPKVYQQSISFSWEIGTSAAPPTSLTPADYVYLAAVQCGPSGIVNLIDCRKVWSLRGAAGPTPTIERNMNFADNGATMNFETSVNTNYGRLSAYGTMNMASSRYVAGGLTLSAGSIYHMYLCVPRLGSVDIVPGPSTVPSGTRTGVLVLSSVGPDGLGRASAPIASPQNSTDPDWGSIPAENCVYIGPCYYRATNSFGRHITVGNLFRLRYGGGSAPDNTLFNQNFSGSGTSVLATANFSSLPSGPYVLHLRAISRVTGMSPAGTIDFGIRVSGAPDYWERLRDATSGAECSIDGKITWPMSLGSSIQVESVSSQAGSHTGGLTVLGWEF